MSKTFAVVTFLAAAAAAQACDICGATMICHPWDPRTGFTLGASEQFTHMTTLQEDGHEIPNDARQKLDSSITQIYLGYHITPQLGVQVNTPLIDRSFRRPTDSGIQTGNIGGIGDVSVAANWLAVDHRAHDFTFQLQLSAGLKLPTGDSSRVLEEASEGHDAAEHEMAISGIHGHDLALGTGSFDGLFGGTVNLRWKRLFFAGEVQYALRGPGRHEYDFADDFQWCAGPGVTLIEKESHTLGISFVCSGETKGEDSFRGQIADDTAMTEVFLGPKLCGSWRDRLSAELAVEIPVHQWNSGTQIMPDYRLKATVSWMF
jgi:hypothetical protein